MARRRVPAIAWVLLPVQAAVLVVSVAALVPSARAWSKALPVLVEGVGGSFPRPLAPEVSRRDLDLEGVTGHLYSPDRKAPAILLVPGAAPRGKDDPRAVRLAMSLARAGRVVFVPDLALYGRDLVEADLDRIVRAALALDRAFSGGGSPTILGISYGGSLAMVAAADPRLRGELRQVAVFGAYYDLVGVIQAVTTGTSVVEGRSYPWTPHPLADEILDRVAVRLAPPAARDELRSALRGETPASDLPPEARGIHALLTNRDPRRTFALADRLPPEARAVLARFSPSTVADRIDTPVVAMHSTVDPAVPYGEAVRLVRGLPRTRLVTVRGFQHVDFRAPTGWLAAAGDLLDAWRFGAWVLEPQE